MSLNRNFLKVCLVSAICLVLLAMGIDSGFAVPCTPCDSWTLIKSCYDDHPPACCTCTKFETLYFYYLTYLQSDPSISPNDILTGKYRKEYEAWRLRLSKQAPIESATWGAIKNLFSAK
jgi:hypothetical protein